MSQSQVSNKEEVIYTEVETKKVVRQNVSPLKLETLGDDMLGMEKVLPSDILLTSERKEEEPHYQQDDDEHDNALLQFLPGSAKRVK